VTAKKAGPRNFSEYAEGLPPETRAVLQKVRKTIARAAPGAIETISYQIPAFTLYGRHVVYFAAYKKHIGMYPVPSADAELNRKLAPYRKGKGTLQFALDKPIPYALIARIVKARIQETAAKAAKKGTQGL
jgi:uncharacterized protein YdhG (YjbR/CyaY superfamily)